jgi:hypothetical protein
MMAGYPCVAQRIMITLRFRVCLKRENRRVKREFTKEFCGKSVPEIGTVS